MGDVFLEQMVKRRDTAKEIFLKVLIFSAGIVVFFLAIMFVGSPIFGPFALLVGVGAIYFAWMLATGLNLEFEYIYTNGEIDFDKIIAKRKRKRMITIRIASFDEFAKYDPQKTDNAKYEVKYNAAISLANDDTYYATFHNKEGKSCILYFSPNERLLEAINVQYKRKNYAR